MGRKHKYDFFLIHAVGSLGTRATCVLLINVEKNLV
jgi:hypothetical protein